MSVPASNALQMAEDTAFIHSKAELDDVFNAKRITPGVTVLIIDTHRYRGGSPDVIDLQHASFCYPRVHTLVMNTYICKAELGFGVWHESLKVIGVLSCCTGTVREISAAAHMHEYKDLTFVAHLVAMKSVLMPARHNLIRYRGSNEEEIMGQEMIMFRTFVEECVSTLGCVEFELSEPCANHEPDDPYCLISRLLPGLSASVKSKEVFFISMKEFLGMVKNDGFKFLD